MAKKSFKHKEKSLIKQTLDKKKINNVVSIDNFKVSFQYLDSQQKYASGFKDWQNCGLLSKLLEVLQGYCCSALLQQVDGDKFTVYGDFPPQNKTLFENPNHIPIDANWARIHITGKAIVAGHIIENTFYVVFLDKSHKFWLTKRITGK